MPPDREPVEVLSYRISQIEVQLKQLTESIDLLRSRLEALHTSLEVLKVSPMPGTAPSCLAHAASIERLSERTSEIERRVEARLEQQAKTLEAIKQKVWIGTGAIIAANVFISILFSILK